VSIWVCSCGAPLLVGCGAWHDKAPLPRYIEKAEEPLLRGMASAIASIEAYLARMGQEQLDLGCLELNEAKHALLMAFKATR